MIDASTRNIFFTLCGRALAGLENKLDSMVWRTSWRKGTAFETFYIGRCQKQRIFQAHRLPLPGSGRKSWNMHKEKRALTGHTRNGYLFYAVMRLTEPLFHSGCLENAEEFYSPRFLNVLAEIYPFW